MDKITDKLVDEYKINAVIMAGGSGTRLWPLSRSGYPKQFLTLNGDDTMLQATIKRLQGLDISTSVTICNEEHRFFVAEQLREIDKLGSMILEPFGKNTAPAVALAAFTAHDDPLLLVLAADHIIQDETVFIEAVKKAVPLAEAGKLVTFGIVPMKAHTGYGYIKKGSNEGSGFIVEKFIEKPPARIANDLVKSGDYLWNSGMFLFRASRYLEELNKFRPDIYEACFDAIQESESDLNFLQVNKEAFSKCPNESIDCAVIEKTSDAVLVPMDAGWSDIGSWTSLWDVCEKNNDGNVTQGDVLMHKSKNCYVRSDEKLVTILGVDDLVVVDTKDALMVAHKDTAEDAKIIAQQLKANERKEWEFHREVHRPWGKYDSIDHGEGYQVKHITVNPGAKLSVQMHHHRAEHWIIISGTAKITNGDRTFFLNENESTYIPVGVTHSLENTGKVMLEVIEVQFGSYLGEDDIVRFEDRYGRVED